MDNHNIVLSWMGVFLHQTKSLDSSYPGWDKGAFDDNDRLIPEVWEEFCRKIANVGANQTRLFTARPFVQVSTNKWDLTKYNEVYFGDIKQMISIAAKYGIRCIISIFDNCEFHLGRLGPYSSNVQKVVFYNDIALSKKILKKFVDELGNTCNYEVCNEPTYTEGWDKAVNGYYCFSFDGNKGKTYEQLVALKVPTEKFGHVYWFACMYEDLIKYNVPAKNIIYGPILSDSGYDPVTKQFSVDSLHYITGCAAEIWRDHGITNEQINLSRMVLHNVGGAPETVNAVKFPYGYDTQFAVQVFGKQATKPRKNPFVSDDGIGQNDPKFAPDGRWTRPNPSELALSCEHIFKNSDGNWCIEVLSYVDLIEAQGDAIAQMHKKIYGFLPWNYGNYPPVPPECQVGEVKKETCWDGSEIITHTCESGKWKETGNVCPDQPDQKCSCFYYLNIGDKFFGIGNFLKCVFKKIDPYCKDKK